MTKVVINSCYGGFGLSPEATLKLYERGVTEIATPVEKWFGDADDPRWGKTATLQQWREYLAGNTKRSILLTVFSPDEKYVLYAKHGLDRSHPELVRIVQEMGEAANGECAELKIVEIPDGIEWTVEEYDGLEHVAQVHETWS